VSPGESATIEGLEPFTLYEFRVIAENHVGRGVASLAKDVQTDEAGRLNLFNSLNFF